MTARKWTAVAAVFVGTVATIGTVPAAAQKAKVEVIQTSSAALARGSTFAWAPISAFQLGAPDPSIANEITADRLRAITEATLVSKGFRPIDNPAEADLIAVYTLVMRPEVDGKLTSDGAGCAFPVCAGPHDYSLDTRQYTLGTLVLDLVERRTGRLVWRATSKKRVTGKDASEKMLTKLLLAMTKSLPAS